MVAAVRRERFPRSRRVRRRVEYVAIQNQGRRLGGAFYLLFAKPAELPAGADARGGRPAAGRVGITVSRKVGNAVVRNRVKRWVRECCRTTLLATMPPGFDLVVVARPAAAKAGLQPTVQELASLVKRLRGR